MRVVGFAEADTDRVGVIAAGFFTSAEATLVLLVAASVVDLGFVVLADAFVFALVVATVSLAVIASVVHSLDDDTTLGFWAWPSANAGSSRLRYMKK